MPTLADIYSAADSFKRRLSDAAMNPGASLQQMLGYANDRAKVLNEMTAAAAEEKDLYGPASQALGRKLAEAYNPIGMTVFHGSPHIFEKFDLSKIGTGEGAQSYGRGLYMAENPQVAKNYQSATSKDKFITSDGFFDPSTIEHLNVRAEARKGNLDKAIELAKKYGQPDADYPETALKAARDLAKLESLKATGGIKKNPGAFYKVDLPDTHVRRMLDWDSPLKSQPKQVRDLAKSLGMDMNDLGGDLLAKVGKDEAGKQILENAGIRGIKYLDERSRDINKNWVVMIKNYGGYDFPSLNEAKAFIKQNPQYETSLIEPQKRTQNFVVFDPNHLTILERNAEKLK